MYNVISSVTSFESKNIKAIGFNPRIDTDNTVLFEKTHFGASMYAQKSAIHILKDNSEYIPIICILNTKDDTNLQLNKDNFMEHMSNYILTKSYGHRIYANERVVDLENIIKHDLETMYSNLNRINSNDSYSKNIPVAFHNYSYDSSIKISAVKTLIFNTKPGRIHSFDNRRSLGHFFYYTYEGQILLTMVIKKEFIVPFKNNLRSNLIDQKHVEIWVDRNIIQGNDRKKFHKYLRDNVMMKLFMRGFTIKEKDNILDELIVKPNVKFKSIDEVKTFKENLNKFLVS